MSIPKTEEKGRPTMVRLSMDFEKLLVTYCDLGHVTRAGLIRSLIETKDNKQYIKRCIKALKDKKGV